MTDCHEVNGACVKCGLKIRTGVKRNCVAKAGLGDYVASLLSSIGITKQRVAKVTGGCGCQKRQEALNTFGSKVAQFFSRGRRHGEKTT